MVILYFWWIEVEEGLTEQQRPERSQEWERHFIQNKNNRAPEDSLFPSSSSLDSTWRGEGKKKDKEQRKRRHTKRLLFVQHPSFLLDLISHPLHLLFFFPLNSFSRRELKSESRSPPNSFLFLQHTLFCLQLVSNGREGGGGVGIIDGKPWKKSTKILLFVDVYPLCRILHIPSSLGMISSLSCQRFVFFVLVFC